MCRALGMCRAQNDKGSTQAERWLQRSLVQPGSAESIQIVLAVGVLPHRQIFCEPGERDIGLRAPQLLECSRGDIMLSGHAGGGGQHTMPAGEIAALLDRFVRQTDGFIVVVADGLGVGGNAIIKRRERIAWTEPQRATRGQIAFFPAPSIA
jgi:hypothetical protein